MAVKIRLMRVGKKKQPTYRVVVADGRSPRDGRFIEIIGQYAPRQDPSCFQIDAESALAWLRKGAQPTEQVQKLLTAHRRVGAVRGRAQQARGHQALAPRLRHRQGRRRREAGQGRAEAPTPRPRPAAPAASARPPKRRPTKPRRGGRGSARRRSAAAEPRPPPRTTPAEDDPNDATTTSTTTTTTTTSRTRSAPRATASSVPVRVAVTEYVTRNLADDPDAIEVEVEERARRGGAAGARQPRRHGPAHRPARSRDPGAAPARACRGHRRRRQGQRRHRRVTRWRPTRATASRSDGSGGRTGCAARSRSPSRSNRPERAAPGAVLYAGDRELVIDVVAPAPGRVARAASTGVDDRTAAEALLGAVLTADPLDRGDVELDDDESGCTSSSAPTVVDRAGHALGTRRRGRGEPRARSAGARRRRAGADGVRGRARATASW